MTRKRARLLLRNQITFNSKQTKNRCFSMNSPDEDGSTSSSTPSYVSRTFVTSAVQQGHLYLSSNVELIVLIFTIDVHLWQWPSVAELISIGRCRTSCVRSCFCASASCYLKSVSSNICFVLSSVDDYKTRRAASQRIDLLSLIWLCYETF